MRKICIYFDGGICCNPQVGDVGETTEDFCEKCPHWEGEDDVPNKD